MATTASWDGSSAVPFLTYLPTSSPWAPVAATTIENNVDPAYAGFSADLESTVYNSSNLDNYTVQRCRESLIRTLAAVGNVRVWNVMLDVVAQTGRYPSSAQNARQFLVEGERRYWVHLAIDRYTGQVLDSVTEIVKE